MGFKGVSRHAAPSLAIPTLSGYSTPILEPAVSALGVCTDQTNPGWDHTTPYYSMAYHSNGVRDLINPI